MNKLTPLEEKALELISKGPERKIPLTELCRLCDCDQRTIYNVVNSLIKKGVPLVAQRTGEISDRGYYIATTERELFEGVQSFQSAVNDVQERLDNIMHADVANWEKGIIR